MRRTLALIVLATTAIVAAGCSGADAQEAQNLLAESNNAFAQVQSATFTARISITGGPEDFEMTMSGGGYASGKHAGDFYVQARGAGLPFGELDVVSRDGRVSMSVDGHALPGAAAPGPSARNPLELVDLTQFVKDVKVDHDQMIDGEPMAKITGTIDTAGLAQGALGQLTGAGGSGLDLSGALGDIRVVVFLSEATHLPTRGLVDVPMDVAGQTIAMHMDFAYTSYDEKVDFPD